MKSLNHLSLDVVLGAVISSSFLTLILGLSINIMTLAVLALVVWAIYTFDHLLDSKIGNPDQMTERHLFHKKHFKTLSLCLLVDLITIFVLLFFLPYKTIIIGAGLGLSVLIYFLTIHLLHWKKIYHKELMVGIVYSSGLLIAPLSEADIVVLNVGNAVKLGPMFLLVIINLLLFSLKDYDYDAASGFPSTVQAIGITKSSKLVNIIGILLIINLGLLYIYSFFSIAMTYTFMFIMLVVIAKFNRSKFIVNNYRLIGDGIFLIPIIYFLF